jgi:hypothetical protein
MMDTWSARALRAEQGRDPDLVVDDEQPALSGQQNPGNSSVIYAVPDDVTVRPMGPLRVPFGSAGESTNRPDALVR